MKKALHDLLLISPVWLIEEELSRAASEGASEVLRFAKRNLVSEMWCINNSCSEPKPIIVHECVLVHGNAAKHIGGPRIHLISSIGVLIFARSGFYWLESDPLFESDRLIATQKQKAFALEMFQIIADHRDYPIWTCRSAVVTFLLCDIPTLHKDAKQIIAKMIWESRREQKTWWDPSISEEYWRKRK
jgi:hypothetical protein